MKNSSPSGSDSIRTRQSASSGFDLLARQVQEWIWRNNWQELRDIQEQAIPLLLSEDSDVIIAAATAGGKTEAAFLPLLSRLLATDRDSGGFDILYVSPLKALINDQFRRLDDLCEMIEIPVHKWHGDVSSAAKTKARRRPRGVLLITPESLEAMFVLRGLEVPGLFAGVECVIIDELHAMLDTERGVQLSSLLSRLEIATRKRIRRVGLSATIGDLELASAYLRPEAPDEVKIVRGTSGGRELKLQLKGYVVEGSVSASHEITTPSEIETNEDRAVQPTVRAIASHLFGRLRGTNNLIFADSRQDAEFYADRLRHMSERAFLPNEFYAHHGNLARDHREFVEERLKRGMEPTNAVCTSTLELGIDIGEVESIAQIGPPFSVASMRQRLGRSGRRAGKAAVMRAYARENALDAGTSPLNDLRLELVRSIAMFELLVTDWCEPPKQRALHLSTLVHQILSVMAERGGATARTLFEILCRRGPFSAVDRALFADVLRCLGAPENPLIEQSPDGTLLLGSTGERLVEHYSFYAVFETPEEYRVVVGGHKLGTLPISFALVEGMTIIFSGRRWRVRTVDDSAKVIEVVPDSSGTPPKFEGGGAGDLHDRVAEEMRLVYTSSSVPRYLDAAARTLLKEGRTAFRRFGLNETSLLQTGDDKTLIFPWQGTATTDTLFLALVGKGLIAAPRNHVTIEVSAGIERVRESLQALATEPAPNAIALAGFVHNLVRDKYHPYLSKRLLQIDVAHGRIAADRVPGLANELLASSRFE